MAQVPPASPNHVNNTEHNAIDMDGSPKENGFRQSPSPQSPPTVNGMNALPDTRQSPPQPPYAIGMNNLSERARQIQTRAPLESDHQEFFKKMRGWLMIVAILAAGSTYQAGLNPPGGVWQSDDTTDGFVAGTPVMHDKFFHRYQAFFYCNAISFLSSLVIIIFLMNRNFYHDSRKIKVLEITMVLDLFSFMAAYAVGSCRRVSSSIYVFLLMGGVFVYVIAFVLIKTVDPCTRPSNRTIDHSQYERQNNMV